MSSILNDTKKILGISSEDTSFDLDIITHINSAFSILHQAGIGPPEGFGISDDEAEWGDFPGIPQVQEQLIKTYMYLQVRMLFDPPTTSYLLSAMQEQINQFLWRLNVNREDTDWTDPTLGEAA